MRETRYRVLAMDWGRRRIGLAVSDELRLIVQTLPTLIRKNRRSDLEALAKTIRDQEAAVLVVGDPARLSGRRESSSSQAEQLGRTLAKLTGAELVMWDERLTSVEAEAMLRAAGARRRRGNVDQIAAALILESYLAHTAEGAALEREPCA